MARHRGLRGAVGAALVAVSDRHERVPRHADRQGTPRPADGPRRAGDDDARPRRPLPEPAWILPIPDARVLPADGDPAEVAEVRETIRLAFIAALQHLPPKQRAVLVLRDVFRWKASRGRGAARHVGGLGQQRAPAGACDARVRRGRRAEPRLPMDEEQRSLLSRYVDAFERYDMDSLTSLLREDAAWSMPPYELGCRPTKTSDAGAWGPASGAGGRAWSRSKPTVRPRSPSTSRAPTGGHEPWALQVLEVSGDRIAGITFFLDTAHLFPLFGLPERLEP